MEIEELNKLSKDYRTRLASLMDKADAALSNGIEEYVRSSEEVNKRANETKLELISKVEEAIKDKKDSKASDTLESYKKMFSSFGLDK